MAEGSIPSSRAMIIYRASGLGGCQKAQIAARLGYEPLPHSPGTEALFREGNLHETDVVTQLTEQGYVVSRVQEEVDIPIFGEVIVRGHIDGVLDSPSEGWRQPKLLEVKSMAQDSYDHLVDKGWAAGGLVEKYKWQISCYMIATGLEGMLVAKNRNRGGLHTLMAERPFYSISDIKHRVITMEATVSRGELPTICDSKNYPCPFCYLHEDDELVQIEDAGLVSLARFYKRAQAEQHAADDKVKAARQAIRKGLGGLKKVSLEGANITIYDAKNPPSYDVKAMEKDGIDVEKYRTQTVGERMRIDLTETNEK